MERMMIDGAWLHTQWLCIGFLLLHGLGLANALHAILNVSSARGAIAWVLSSITLPYVAIPLYWVIGRNRFQGYREAYRIADLQYQDLLQQLQQEIQRYGQLSQSPQSF